MQRVEVVQVITEDGVTSSPEVMLAAPPSGEYLDVPDTSDAQFDSEGPRESRQNSIKRMKDKYHRVSKKVMKVLSFEETTGHLKDAFMPNYWSLRVAGLVYMKNKDRCCSFSMIHSIFVLVLLWSDVLRIFFAYDKSDGYSSLMMVKIMIHVWCTETAICSTIFLVRFRVHMPRMIQAWQEYRNTYSGIPTKTIKKTIFKVTLIFWICYAIFFSSSMIIFHLNQSYLNKVNTALVSHVFRKGKFPKVAALLHQMFFMYMVLLYMLPLVTVCTMCNFLRLEFKRVTSALRSESLSCESQDFIEDIRQRHAALSKIVLKMDSIASGYLLCLYGMDIPMLCFNIFIVMFDDHKTPLKDNATVLAQMVSFALCFSHVASITFVGAALTSAARSPKLILYDTDVKNLTASHTTSLQLFLARLNEHIGLTAWQLINVERGLIVTIFSMIVSYVVVLFKFGIALVPQVTPDMEEAIHTGFINTTQYQLQI